jgi:hypothetical protein
MKSKRMTAICVPISTVVASMSRGAMEPMIRPARR